MRVVLLKENKMSVAIVVVTHNRFEYSKKTIARLLEEPNEEFDLYLWDNASTDETPDYLRDGVKDARLVEVVLSKENVGQTGAMNYVWGKTKAELVGKLDNDCLVTPGWTKIFAQAHKDIEKLGSLACWPFLLEDFDEAAASQKIISLNGHKVFRHPWTCGSGFILKRKTFLAIGPWRKGYKVGTTRYFLNLAIAGYINGWYYPLVMQEHMDDIKSKHSRFHHLPFKKAYKDAYGFKVKDIHGMKKYMRVRRAVIHNLMSEPYDPKYYCGWRVKVRNLLNKIRGI